MHIINSSQTVHYTVWLVFTVRNLKVTEKIKFSSKLILVSSAIFWNWFRIVGPESVSRIDFGIGSGIGCVIDFGIGLRIGSESAPISETITE